MHSLKSKTNETNVCDGFYIVESIYANRKPTSKQKIKVENGRVHTENPSCSLSVETFFHDHEIVCKL